MISNGLDAVAAIKILLDRDAKQEEVRARMELAKLAEPDLIAMGIVERAPDLFQLFRDSEMESMRRRIDAKREATNADGQMLFSESTVFAGKMRRWGNFSSEALRDFEEKHRHNYTKCRNELFQSRIKTTHVKAVLRPFSARYLDSWADARMNGLDFGAIQVRVEKLLSQPIENELRLRTWSEEVYELFKEVAVLKNTDEPRLDPSGDRNRPLGAIGERSERTYSQQWSRWFKDNSSRLMQDTFESGPIPSNNPEFAYGYFQQSAPGAPSGYSANRPVSQANSMTTENDPIIIRVESVDSPLLSSESAFASRQKAIDEVVEWCNFLSSIWGGPNQTVVVELELKTAGNVMKVKLPATPLSTAGAQVKGALNSYKS